ncbi:GAF domain-containing protein [Tardisphaera saccharovorans]|nr:GAF domain-containing protein [TACK group archaeon]
MESVNKFKNLLYREGAKGLLGHIKNERNYDWIGIYVRNGDKLVLAIEIGAPANHRVINVGEGICGLAAKEKKTVVVDDVSKEKNYLACFPSTKSEIVVPILRGSDVLGEIDVDSDTLNAFGITDQKILSDAAAALSESWDKLDFRIRVT